MDECVDGYLEGWMDAQTDGWMSEWVGGSMDKRIQQKESIVCGNTMKVSWETMQSLNKPCEGE